MDGVAAKQYSQYLSTICMSYRPLGGLRRLFSNQPLAL